jgi:hypothetical protein
VTATHTQTNLTREVVTKRQRRVLHSEYPVRNVQVAVRGAGLSDLYGPGRARDPTGIRASTRNWAIGTLEEALTVTATAAILQTENAAVQHIAQQRAIADAADQRPCVPSFMTLMPGVADPKLPGSRAASTIQGGRVSLTVNGQPSTNTVVRLDGITATNQVSFENIQSYGPSLEAIETVNVVHQQFRPPIRAWRVRPRSTCR